MIFDVYAILGNVEWNYSLEDGICTDSMAFQTAKKYGISKDIIERAQVLGNIFDKVCRLNNKTSIEYENLLINQQTQSNQSNINEVNNSMMNEIIINMNEIMKTYNLNDIIPIVATVSELTIEDTLIINHDEDPPPFFEGKSCLYVLQIQPKSHIKNNNKINTYNKNDRNNRNEINENENENEQNSNVLDLLYVGETESIQQRLSQHRQSRKNMLINAIIINLPNKSKARLIESKLIKILQKQGYVIEQDSDANHILFGNN